MNNRGRSFSYMSLLEVADVGAGVVVETDAAVVRAGIEQLAQGNHHRFMIDMSGLGSIGRRHKAATQLVEIDALTVIEMRRATIAVAEPLAHECFVSVTFSDGDVVRAIGLQQRLVAFAEGRAHEQARIPVDHGQPTRTQDAPELVAGRFGLEPVKSLCD